MFIFKLLIIIKLIICTLLKIRFLHGSIFKPLNRVKGFNHGNQSNKSTPCFAYVGFLPQIPTNCSDCSAGPSPYVLFLISKIQFAFHICKYICQIIQLFLIEFKKMWFKKNTEKCRLLPVFWRFFALFFRSF